MNDISKYLFNTHNELKRVYENVNIGDIDIALNHAEEALFHIRCSILWLRERINANQNNI